VNIECKLVKKDMMKMYFVNNFTCENKMLDHKTCELPNTIQLFLIIKVNKDMKKSLSIKKMSITNG
jgi:hypothetical protein